MTKRRYTALAIKCPQKKVGNIYWKKLKKVRKIALSNVTRQINKIKPLLSSFSNRKLVHIKLKKLDELFALMHGINQNYKN